MKMEFVPKHQSPQGSKDKRNPCVWTELGLLVAVVLGFWGFVELAQPLSLLQSNGCFTSFDIGHIAPTNISFPTAAVNEDAEI